MTIVTPYMLRKKLYEVNKMSSNPNNINSPMQSNIGTGNNEEEDKISLVQLTIEQVQGNNFIDSDGKTWLLYNAIPGIDWVCTGQMTGNGVCVLEHPFQALGITDGTNNFLLGVSGATDEFEVRVMSNDTKVQIQKEYVSIQTPHLLKNGLEEK